MKLKSKNKTRKKRKEKVKIVMTGLHSSVGFSMSENPFVGTKYNQTEDSRFTRSLFKFKIFKELIPFNL